MKSDAKKENVKNKRHFPQAKSNPPIQQFKDERTESGTMQRMQKVAHQSQQVAQLQALQSMINKSVGNASLSGQAHFPLQAKYSPHPISGGVVQRRLDTNLLKGRTRHYLTRDLAKLGNQYNHGLKSKSRAERLSELQTLQNAILRSLDQFADPDHYANPIAVWKKELLNDVQQEHLRLVRQSVDNKDQNPPVANFSKLNDSEQKTVLRIWKELLSGSGNIKITETESFKHSQTQVPTTRNHPGFRYEVLAQFARLLETQTGRTLVGQITQRGQKKTVTIKPGFAEAQGGGPASEFAAGPTKLNGADKLTKIDINQMFKGQPYAKRKRESYRRNFITLDLSRINNPKKRAAAIYQARRDFPKSSGIKIGNQYYKYGKGSNVEVFITRDIPDSIDHHTSRFVDNNRNEIPTPNFVTLGHELGHAEHMQTGVSLGDASVSDTLFQHTAPNVSIQDYSNYEEFANINAVENNIRTNIGLKHRYGHINQPAVQKARLEPIANSFYNLSDLQPRPLRASVEAPLGLAARSLAQLHIAPARAQLRQAADVFIGNLVNAFPNFTNHERNAIQVQLNGMKNNVNSAQQNNLNTANQQIQQAINLINAANQRLAQQAAAAPANNNNHGGGIYGFFRGLLPF